MDGKGSNKYNLRLSSLSPNDRNNAKNKSDEELLNILPSYHMYQSIISKNLTPTNEDLRTDPPSYEITPISSVASSETSSVNDYFVDISLPTSPDNTTERENEEDDFMSIDNTILTNAHKLKRLTAVNKQIAKDLKIDIYLTEEIGKIGVAPKIIDPLSFELKQGDYIYGFVTVTNTTQQCIPFDMFPVVFEGALIVGQDNKPVLQRPVNIVRFLTMFDFNASWNDGILDRFVSDNNNPHIPKSDVDPYDNTQIQLNHKKIFEPNVTYKKFFTFKLPDKLLDSSCAPHGLVKHLQVPPTMGVSKNEVITSLRRKWRDNSDESGILSPKADDNELGKNQTHYASLTNDFAFPDTAISYCISARIIGRASGYDQLLLKNQLPLDPAKDEYVVANENYCYLRFVGDMDPIFELNRSLMNEEAKLMSSNMIEKIKDYISLSKEMSNLSIDDRNSMSYLHPTSSATELAKMRQSYYSKIRKSTPNENVYEVYLLYRKKSIIGAHKIIGVAALSSPKTHYRVPYVPLPKLINSDTPTPSTKIQIPLDLTFIFSEGQTKHPPPDFKHISVELIAITIKSKNLPIPIVFHHDMLFQNKSKGSDNFDYITIRLFQKYAIELSKVLKESKSDPRDLDRDLIRDVKCLANLSSKYDHFKIQNPRVSAINSTEELHLLSSIPWEAENLVTRSSKDELEEQVKYSKKFTVNIDIANATLNPSGSQDLCLIPDFQYCFLARLYYIKIKLKCPNGDKMTLKVPLILQKERV